MKIKFILVALLMGTSLARTNAETITCEQASNIASRFFEQRTTRAMQSNSVRLLWSSDCTQERATRVAEPPTFYTFVREEGKGFVIVAGDDAVRPILGYSLDNTMLPYEEMPDNFREWLAGVDEEIRFVRSMGISEKTVKADENVGKVVKQLETAAWGQGAPFNGMCPKIGNTP